tara:strand:+ start:484 stop:1803 length:1320 start_codon:yes stop_codon:yes gene_type:complete
MTYDPRQSFKAQQLSYARAAGTQTSKQQGISKGRGTPDYSSSAYDSGGYDEIKLPTASQVDKKISGLGSPSSGDKDDRNLDQKIYDGMKYYGAKFLGLDKPDPRADDMFLLEVYGGDDMFVIPEPTPVTVTGIGGSTYDFIDMSKLGSDPKQPRTQPNMDTTPQIGGYDEAPVTTPKVPGLMSPPTIDQPNIVDDEIGRLAGEVSATAAYTIQSGDTLGEIAEATGTTVEELMVINGIEDKHKIVAGKDIKIPIYRDVDAEVVENATSMKELEPIKTAYPLVNALPPLKPNVSLEDAIITRLKAEEGIDYVAEKKFGEEFYTIGHGHYGADVKEGQTITAKEADALLRKDLAKRMPKIRRAIKNYDKLSQELQVEIAQSWFRGGIAGSPKTIRLINEGKFQEASEEFLDNNEYRTTTLRGVKRRMKGLSDTLAKEANRI